MEVDLSPRRYTLFAHAVCPFVERAVVALRELGQPLADLVRVYPVGLEDMPSWYWENIYKEATVPAILIHKDASVSTKQSHQLKDGEDGKVIGESLDIVKFLDGEAKTQAALFGLPAPAPLFPEKEEDAARVNAFIEAQGDFVGKCYELLSAKKADRDRLKDSLNEALAKLEGMMADNGPFVLGSKISAADIAIAPFLYRFQFTLKAYRDFELLAKSPKFKALLAAWIRRPSVRVTTLPAADFISAYKSYAAEGEEEAAEGKN